MTLDEKIAMVHGAGLPAAVQRRRLRRRRPGEHPARHPRALPGRLAGRRRQRLDRRHPVGGHVRAGLDLGHVAGVRLRRAYGAEQAGKGHNIALAPTVNILRLPLWGRAPETFSEDPYLTGAAARAPRSAASRASTSSPPSKHFVANNQEVLRSPINVVAQHAHAAGDLPARVQDGGPAGRRRRGHVLLQPGQRHLRLRERRGARPTPCATRGSFDGLVMSDWGALHSTVKAAAPAWTSRCRAPARPTRPRSTSSSGRTSASKLKAAVLDGSVPHGHPGRDGHATS